MIVDERMIAEEFKRMLLSTSAGTEVVGSFRRAVTGGLSFAILVYS